MGGGLSGGCNGFGLVHSGTGVDFGFVRLLRQIRGLIETDGANGIGLSELILVSGRAGAGAGAGGGGGAPMDRVDTIRRTGRWFDCPMVLVSWERTK